MLLGCLEDVQKLLKTCLFFYFFRVRRRLFLDIFARIWYNIIRSTVRSNRSTKWLLILQILFADDAEFLYFKGFQRFGDILGDIQGPKGRGFKSRRLNQKIQYIVDVLYFFIISAYATGLEGGKNFSGEKLFCFESLVNRKNGGKTGRLIIVHWGAPLKAQVPSPQPKITDSRLTVRYFFVSSTGFAETADYRGFTRETSARIG